jgi:uncharacterized membrane protein
VAVQNVSVKVNHVLIQQADSAGKPQTNRSVLLFGRFFTRTGISNRHFETGIIQRHSAERADQMGWRALNTD